MAYLPKNNWLGLTSDLVKPPTKQLMDL